MSLDRTLRFPVLVAASLLMSNLLAEDYWEYFDESDEGLSVSVEVNTQPPGEVATETPASDQNRAAETAPQAGTEAKNAGDKKQLAKPVAPPRPKVLPDDPSIRIRHPGNNPTINKNLRVSMQHNYMKEAVRWYDEGADVNSTDHAGRSLLWLAITRGHMDGIKFLLLRRADVNQQNNDGTTPLTAAVTRGQFQTAQMLMERGARVIALKSGEEMLHYAIRKGYEQLALTLMEKPFDPNQSYGSGNTLLHLASTRGLTRVVNQLISRGAVVNATNQDDLTPLHEAAARGHYATAQALLGRKGSVKASTRKKWTPLHHAARFGHKQVVELLLAHGASSNAINSDGKTPLALAEHLKHVEVVEILDSRTTVARRARSSSSGGGGWRFW